MRNLIDWRLFFVLWLAGILATVALFPYLFAMGLLDPAVLPAPLSLVLVGQVVQNGLLLGVAVFLGLHFGNKVGLGPKYLPAWLRGERVNRFGPVAGQAAVWGILAGLAIFAVSEFVLAFDLGGESAAQSPPPVWTRVVASFYGGITEELLMRLGLMTIFVWLTWKFRRAPDGGPTAAGVWLAIITASVLFGLGHLPAAALQVEITPWVVLGVVVLNSIGGIPFGWLYWRWGLEAAIVSHFSADIVLQVLVPIFFS